jgi:hypothetical protein
MTAKAIVPAILPAIAALAASFGMTGIALAGTAPSSSMQLHFAGAERVNWNTHGGLDIVNHDGNIWHYSPDAYQVVNGKRVRVLPSYKVVSKDRVELEFRNVDPSAEVKLANAPKSAQVEKPAKTADTGL